MVASEGMNPHMVVEQRFGDALQIHACASDSGDMHAVERWNRLEPFAAVPLQRVQQRLAALVIDLAHLAHVARKMTFGNEPRNSELNRRRAMPVETILRDDESLHCPA